MTQVFTRATERRVWWILFASLSVAIGSWALASPLMSGHDEASHAVRGAAVVRGQLLGDEAPGAFPEEPTVFIAVDVPEAYELTGQAGCFHDRRELTPACAPDLVGGRDRVPVLTYQFRSPPAYYAVVALPTLVDPAAAGMYATRLVSGAICAAFLASALISARRSLWSRWTVLGVLLAATPEVLYLAASINSNAVEVAASICLWSSLAAMVGEPSPPSRLVTRCGLALVVLVSTRGLSPAYGALVVVAVAVVAGGFAALTWVRRRDVRAWGIATVVATMVSLAYIEWVRRELPITRPGQGLAEALDKVPWYLRQAVGIFGANDIPLPTFIYVVWAAGTVLLVSLALALAPRRHALVVMGVAVAGVAVQIGAEGFSLPPIGFFWQGRYALPILTGVPILAGHLVARAGQRVEALERLVPWGVGLLGICHLAALLQTVRRFAVTLDGPANPITYLTDPRWSPDTAPAPVWVVAFSAGLGMAGWSSLRPARFAG